MDNPYAAASAAAPEPLPRRALFSGIVASVFCLLSWFGVAGYFGGDSFYFSQVGFFVEPSPDAEMARLQVLWRCAPYALIAASGLCLALGVPRLRVGALRRARIASIWLLAAGACALGIFILYSIRLMIAGMR